MKNISRYSILTIPFLTFLLLEVYLFIPKTIFVTLFIIIASIVLAIRNMAFEAEQMKKWINYSILPVSFTLGLIVFSSLVQGFLPHLLFILCALFLHIYLKESYYHLRGRNDKQLQNLSSYGNFLAVYFLSSSVYGLQSFLNFKIWIMMLFMIVILGLIAYEMMWVNGVDKKENLIYVPVVGLVLVEVIWSASYLTYSFFILGFMVAVCYYIVIGISKYFLLEKLDKKVLRDYLLFGFGSIILVLLTARWL